MADNVSAAAIAGGIAVGSSFIVVGVLALDRYKGYRDHKRGKFTPQVLPRPPPRKGKSLAELAEEGQIIETAGRELASEMMEQHGRGELTNEGQVHEAVSEGWIKEMGEPRKRDIAKTVVDFDKEERYELDGCVIYEICSECRRKSIRSCRSLSEGPSRSLRS